MRSRLVLAAGLLAAAGAAAEPPAYRDDRSDPAALIESLYNALNRQEYARAWDYFGETKPTASYEAFVQGYAGTESVELRLGEITSEGAAGSVFSQAPVAIRAREAGGATRVFAGCYTVRQVDPSIQEPPFQPLQIESGKLAPASGELEAAVPAGCD